MRRGDIVDIRYRGVVTYVDESGDMEVQPEGATIRQETHVDYATVVRPVWMLGDFITPDSTEPPPGTVIANAAGGSLSSLKVDGSWHATWRAGPMTWDQFIVKHVSFERVWKVLQVPE